MILDYGKFSNTNILFVVGLFDFSQILLNPEVLLACQPLTPQISPRHDLNG
jgi:hypothetical protein